MNQGEKIDPKEFRSILAQGLMVWDSVYVFNAGGKPVGYVGGKFLGMFMILADMEWFPWATTRQKYESAINLLNELRKRFVVIGTAEQESKRFWGHICKYGIIRRIGTLQGVFVSGPAAMYQTIGKP